MLHRFLKFAITLTNANSRFSISLGKAHIPSFSQMRNSFIRKFSIQEFSFSVIIAKKINK